MPGGDDVSFPGRGVRAAGHGAGPLETVSTTITCVDYGPDASQVERVTDLPDFLERHRPTWAAVRWIDVEGFADLDVIRALAAKYDLHPLALEDLLSDSQRPKIDAYGGAGSAMTARLFITTRVLHLRHGHLHSSPVSIFLGHTTVLTFQARATGVLDPVRRRATLPGSRIRGEDASFLTYSLLDAVVDACFPIIDHFDGHLDRLERAVVEHAEPTLLTMIQDVKRQFTLLRWGIWPLREVVAALQRDTHECMSEATQVYLHDLYDHVVQVVEINESYRERAADLTESYRSAVSYRLNEVMRMLTVISTVFIPLTFLAGVYGMNFRVMPELQQSWAYPAFWVLSLAVAGGMVAMFRRRRWL